MNSLEIAARHCRTSRVMKGRGNMNLISSLLWTPPYILSLLPIAMDAGILIAVPIVYFSSADRTTCIPHTSCYEYDSTVAEFFTPFSIQPYTCTLLHIYMYGVTTQLKINEPCFSTHLYGHMPSTKICVYIQYAYVNFQCTY